MKKCREGYETIRNKLLVRDREYGTTLYTSFRLQSNVNLYQGNDPNELIEVIHHNYPVGINRFVRKTETENVELTRFLYMYHQLKEVLDHKVEIRKADLEVLTQLFTDI